jgi:HTH-type transcriptional regulator, sugar sensing transcriptional regulator
MNLEKFGLTKTESGVYLALLKEGNSLASIIVKKLQLHRATVYDVLNRLIERGLVSYVEVDGKKYFEASKPEKFLDIINEKEQAIEKEKKEAKQIVIELSKIKEKTSHSNVQVLTGKEGVKNLMQELLNHKEFMIIGGELRFKDYLPIYTIHWAKEREKRKIYARILTEYKIDTKWEYNIYRQLSKDIKFPTSVIIYGDKIAIILPEKPVKIILIESSDTYRAYKAQFEILWKTSHGKEK